MGDNRRRHQRHEAMDREQSGCQVLGLGWVGLEAGFDHVAQDGDDEAIEEGFCLGKVSMGGITGNLGLCSLPANKPSVEVKIGLWMSAICGPNLDILLPLWTIVLCLPSWKFERNLRPS